MDDKDKAKFGVIISLCLLTIFIIVTIIVMRS